jgi:TRAP-type C4-dicarboxylate transport system substrate-binding protein
MKPVHLHFGGYQSSTSVHTKAAAVLGKALATRLGDAVQFNLDGNIIASGHLAADLLPMVESGALTMCYFSASYLAARVPQYALLDLPFTIADRGKAYAVLDGALGHLLAGVCSGAIEAQENPLTNTYNFGIHRLTDAERARFVEAVAPVVEEQRHAFGNRLFGYLES